MISYNASEGVDTETGSSIKNSVWGFCTALLSQPMLTVPLIRYSEDGSERPDAGHTEGWMPRFIREMPMGSFDPFSETQQEWMDAFLKESWEHSPMYMHYIMRYVPSMSMMCENAAVATG